MGSQSFIRTYTDMQNLNCSGTSTRPNQLRPSSFD
ncbi:hypothetical protein [Sporisorium scitamineum]|uniref:Uncharacterized protein n=1 Tax=Sporisorium scitamineum TaxID=49012 RepID=A0A0F7RVH1_9BASI|nr:hypothetical protein [Sporisorium scitamineum]